MKHVPAALLLLLLTALIPHVACAENREPGRVLVLLKSDVGTVTASRLRSAAGESYVARVAGNAGARVMETWPALSEARGKIFALMASDAKTTEELMAELKADPRVIGVGPDFKVRAVAEPDDPGYTNGSLWGLKTIRTNEAWDETTGSDTIRVAVADTGIFAEHEDLRDNVDLTYSRNFSNGTHEAPAPGGSFNDGDGHGTHVSGTIGAAGNNGRGVVGVNWKVKIIALKVLDDNGEGYMSWSLGALDYLVDLLKRHPDLKISAVNFSLGGWAGLTPSAIEANRDSYWEAFKALDELNRTVIVVAAGNEGLEVGAPAPFDDAVNGFYKKGDYVYPASLTGLENMVVVAAVDHTGQSPTYSNWSATAVQFGAPGVGIMSTATPVGSYDGQRGLYYAIQQGTSMATPHVSGAVALLASKYPNFGAKQLKAALLAGANGSVNYAASSPVNLKGQKLSSNGLLDVRGALDVLSSAVPASGVDISPAEDFSIQVGETRQLDATVSPENAFDRSVVWSSSNTAVAAVDRAGLVTAIGAGSARITAGASGGTGVEDSVNVTVTAGSSAEYAVLPRSAVVSGRLASVNDRVASLGVRMDFASLNNAMANWRPGANREMLSSVQLAVLAEQSAPSFRLSGWTPTGKPAVAVDVNAVFEAVGGKVLLLPVTMQYTLQPDELTALLGAARAAQVLANPVAHADVLFETLALFKATTGGTFLNLVPDAVSPENAMKAGIMTLKGGSSLLVAVSFLVADDAGPISFDGAQLVVPDGVRDGHIQDPLWLMKADSETPPEPTGKSGGGGGCSAGVGLSALLPVFLVRRRSARR